MKRLDKQIILNLKTCYSEKKINSFFEKKDSYSLEEIIALDIPKKDKAWLIKKCFLLNIWTELPKGLLRYLSLYA